MSRTLHAGDEHTPIEPDYSSHLDDDWASDDAGHFSMDEERGELSNRTTVFPHRYSLGDGVLAALSASLVLS